MQEELYYREAVELAESLRTGQLSARELMSATLERIAAVNPAVNAIVTQIPEAEALALAEAADAALTGGRQLGPLHGLPIAVKDLALTAGIRTTFGSLIYKDWVPDRDDLFVTRLKDAGAIIIGKTNTPEFGAGSQTFNAVFGPTRNPYSLDSTVGGSSGGAAAALASGMLPIADGSDLGGSLRNPAAFCNVVGFRPSPGRVPIYPSEMAWGSLGVIGPMGRTVRDVAMLLSVMAGPDARDPISIEETGDLFQENLQRDFVGTRIAWTPDLGRYLVDPRVVDTCESALAAFRELGCEIEHDTPDVRDADNAFQALRGELFVARGEQLLERHGSMLKETVRWNIRMGLEQSGIDVARARMQRTEIYHRFREFLTQYRFLVLPTTQVPPFDVEIEWVQEINGQALTNYLDWMGVCYAITLTGLPAISVPAGFTPDGLPIGLQIVGRHHADFEVLQLAHAFEQVTRHGRVRPTAIE